MAERYPGDAAARNGFGRHWLTAYECQLLHECGYPAPPDFRVTTGWALSAGGVPVPPVPEGHAYLAQVELARSALSAEERADPAHHPGNHAAWGAYFAQRRQAQLAAFDGPPPAPKRKNSVGRATFWSVEGRTLQHVIDHIEGGNTPPLGFPSAAPPPSVSRRRGFSSWLSRRMTTPASSSSTSASHSSGTSPALSSLVKREAPSSASPTRSPPRTRARARYIVINEPAPPTPPTGHLRLVTPKKEPDTFARLFGKAKKEPGNAAVLEPRTAEEEEILLKIATERSLQETVSAPEEEARWSLDDWRKTEARRQQRLLGQTATRRTLGREEAGVIVLDSDDEDDEDGPAPTFTRFRQGDDGQGCSSSQPPFQPGPPSDDDDDDGDDDYTVFYGQLGML